VAEKLKDQLKQEAQLCLALRVDPQKWAKERIGTIHTFQGREADTVILVLGAPNASQSGARKWAADTRNTLNVAVSRAKQRLYVVGSRGAWSGVGCARELASSLPSRIQKRCRSNSRPNVRRHRRSQRCFLEDPAGASGDLLNRKSFDAAKIDKVLAAF
jgi:hypothetical protein